MTKTVAERVTTIIAEHLALSESVVLSHSSISKDLGADSLDASNLLIAINEEFSLRIPLEVLETIDTVSQLTEVVQLALEKQSK